MEDFNSKYSGEQVEALLDQVASGNAGGGGGGITAETDPIFSNSPAASITEDDKKAWNNMVPYSVKDFSMVSADGFMTSDGDGFVFPNTPVAQAGQGFVLATLDDVGVGVQSVEQTTTSNADGGSNIVTVTLTDGTESTFTVKNGSKGSQGEKGDTGETGPQGPQGIQGEQGPKGDTGDKGDTGANGTNGTNGKDGADGEDGATFTPSVDSAGNLSWSNNKGLVNPPTVNIKGPKGDKGDAGSGGGGSSEKEIVDAGNGVIEVLEPNKIYIMRNVDNSLTFEVQSIVEPDGSYAEYCVIIYATTFFGVDLQPSISLPEGLRWANGSVPDITKQGVYELNIVYSGTVTDSGFNAVLTRFQYVD